MFNGQLSRDHRRFVPYAGIMNIWNAWAASYRNARSLAMAGIMLAAIISMLSLRCNPLVGREDVLGLVLTVEAEGLHPLGAAEAQTRVVVATPDSVEVRVFLPPPVPRVGDFVPLVVERYKKGDTSYFVDQTRWRLEGAQ